jgi:hypothetical protein
MQSEMKALERAWWELRHCWIKTADQEAEAAAAIIGRIWKKLRAQSVDRDVARYDDIGPRRCVGQSDNGKWVLVRRPGASVHVVSASDWLKMPSQPSPQ